MRIQNSTSDMMELEDTKSEIRREIDLQFSIWDRLNNSSEDEAGSPIGYNGSASPLGDFFDDAAYAWLSCGSRLVVVNVKTGTSISSWTFRDRVTCVSPFPSQPGQVPLLLVGLDNGANKIRESSGLICVFDCTGSQVLRAIRMPAGVEQVCVVIGGAEWEDFGDERIDNFPVENSGLACVALRNLDHLMIDLRRSSWEGPDATAIADEASPVELDFSPRNESASLRPADFKFGREKHLAYNLMNRRVEQYIEFNRERFESTMLYQETLTSSMICSRKIGCLVSGCLGRIIIWQMDGVVRWVSPPMGDNISINNLALLEPSDDPRPYCYLWASYQEETSRLPPVLRMYSMLFERKYSDKGSNAYFKLKDDPSQHFELELAAGNRIANLQTIVRESNPEQTESGNKREENLLLISLDSRTLLFDLNQWYKERMPRTLGDCENANAFLASYRTRSDLRSLGDDAIVNCSYVPSTLKEFPCHGSSPPEELFYPNSLYLEWVELGRSGRLTFWMTRGVQAELLREMSLAGPVILLEPTETFNRCLSSGLIPLNAECSANSGKDVQRDTLLSLCLEQRWSTFLLRCAKEWSDGSASYLFQSFLRWGYQRAVAIKRTADLFCIPLFDESDSNIGEAEVKTLRFLSQQSECISNVITNLLIDSIDLTKERRSLRRISTYLQVLLWFYDVGLLPETQKIDDDEATPQLSFSLKIPYPFVRLATIYKEKRQQFSAQSRPKDRDKNEEDLFIDELLTRECSSLKLRWEREGCDDKDRGADSDVKRELSIGGNYPPSSLQTLLRSYLEDFHNNDDDTTEMENKHQITIYLLMDLAMLLQESYPEHIYKTLVDQLIKYPSAFKLSPSFIQLTQALWRLDHENYEGFLNIMTSQLVADSDVKDWHHKLVLRTLIRNNQNKLALVYLRVRKPPLSSLDDQGIVISLSVEHGLVQSAFHRRPPSHYTQLLTRFFQACKNYGKLNDILHLALDSEEEEAFVKYLENEKFEDTRLLYYLQRCRYAEASNVYPMGLSTTSGRGNFVKSTKPASLTIYNAYNATLPDITRKFSNNMARRIHDIDPASRYPRPMSHCKSRGVTREIHEMVIRKAKETFVRADRTQIPFISAPCSSLRMAAGNVDTNCVLFVERAKKPYGKRSLDEMCGDGGGDGTNNDNNGEERKRRKTSSVNDNDASQSKEVGTSMVYDTPLIRRKNQLINARSTPIETPHSILKIRVRESTSPSIVRSTVTEVEAKKVIEKERKPRHIRFSEGQQQQPAEESMDEDAPSDTDDVDKNLAQADANEESDETEKSLSKCELSEEEEQQDEEEGEETFFSPNVSNKSLSETTLLSDSSYVSRNMSGPRPRPSLRRSTLSNNESSSDLLRRSLMKVRNSSTRVSSDLSSHETNKSHGSLSFSQSPRARDSLLSTSIYSETMLSPDTSFEYTPTSCGEKIDRKSMTENFGSFVDRTADKIRDFQRTSGVHEKNENMSRFSRSVTVKTVTRTTVSEGYSRDAEEDKNSEILMEVDGFGLDRDSDTRSQPTRESNWEFDQIADTRENFSLPKTQSSIISEVSVTQNNTADMREEEKEEKIVADRTSEQRDLGDGWPRRDVSMAKIQETQEIVEDTEITEDYDDELLALRYDEEEDAEEAFQSLTNSMDVDCSTAKLSSDKSASNDDTKKILSSNNGFYEEPKLPSQEFTITDDESSRSVGESSILSGSTNASKGIHEKSLTTKKVDEEIADDASNMTDDESERSRDSSISSSKNLQISKKNLDQQKTSDVDKINEAADDSSLDFSIFSSKSHQSAKKNLEEQKNLQTGKIVSDAPDDSSHDSSIFSSRSRQSVKRNLENVKNSRVEKITNDTADESSRDSPIFSSKSRQSVKKNFDEETNSRVEKFTNDAADGSSHDSSIFSGRNRKNNSQLDSEKIANESSSSFAETVTSNESKELETMEFNAEGSPVPKKGRQSTRISKIGTFTPKGLAKDASKQDNEAANVTPLRMTRSRRASSVAQESLASPVVESPSAKSKAEKVGRLRRGSSLVKDLFTVTDNNTSRGVSHETEDPQAKDIFGTKSLAAKESPKDEEIPVRRSTRRAASVQKEMSATTGIVPKPRTRASSKPSLTEDTADDEPLAPVVSTTKITAREKRGSSVAKGNEAAVTRKRLTRASSLAKDIPEENAEIVEPTKRVPRKRGSSVPKETPLESSINASLQRTRRGGSVAKKMIPEEVNESPNESQNISSSGKANEISSPASSTRTRLSSFTSIAEEEDDDVNDDEIFTASSRRKAAAAVAAAARESKKKISTTRERRAVSVDPPLVDIKRRTRAASLKSAISEDPIEEENSDTELSAGPKSRATRKAPTRRKRTASDTSVKDDEDFIGVKKLPQRRTRKLSQRSNDSTDNFRWSPPDPGQGRPDNDDKGTDDEVPVFAFSQPHIRSKYPTPNQPQN